MWELFDPDYAFHQTMLDDFLNTPNLPQFVSSRKDLKIDKLLDNTSSRFWLLIKNGRMIGCGGIYVLDDSNGIQYAKYPYRQFIIRDNSLSSKIFNSTFELDLMQSWREQHPTIPTLTTINEGNERVLFHTIKRIQRFFPQYSQEYKQFNLSLELIPSYILEMNTWQFGIISPEYATIERELKPIQQNIKDKINGLWMSGYWYGKHTERFL